MNLSGVVLANNGTPNFINAVLFPSIVKFSVKEEREEKGASYIKYSYIITIDYSRIIINQNV